MNAFIEPLKIATLVFPVVTFLLTFPYIVYQYRKKGSMSFLYSVLVFLFVYYLMCAYFLVILPLPDIETITASYRDMMQLTPFQFVNDLMREWKLDVLNPKTYLYALTQPVFTQLVFNVFLTIPFGIFLRYFFNLSALKTLIATFFMSLFFEVSQLSGLFFIYSGPYRLFDIDDLILNTLGGTLGYFLAPFFTFLIPSKVQIDQRIQTQATSVSLLKRGITFILDIMILNVAISFFQNFFNSTFAFLFYFIGFMIYFAVFPYCFQNQTFAQRFLKIKTLPLSSRSFFNYVLRALCIYIFVYQIFGIVNLLLQIAVLTENYDVVLFYLVIIGLWLLGNAVYWCYFLLKRPKQTFYDRISHIHVVSYFNEK